VNNWICKNAPLPEVLEIRIRYPMELIADQCVNPIIHFLWKEYVHINYHIKRNSNNEDVYCDIMSSEWARKTLEVFNTREASCATTRGSKYYNTPTSSSSYCFLLLILIYIRFVNILLASVWLILQL